MLGRSPGAPVPRAALAAGGALLTLALLSGLSGLWADSPERAFLEFDRVTMYLGVFALAVLATRRGDAGRVVDALALGIGVVALLALGQRCVPSAFPADQLPRFLPGAGVRLSYPVGYWNGLAALVALGVPLALRAAVDARAAALRGLAVGAVPLLAAVVYLASSRGGAVVAAVGAAAFVALTGRRVAASAALGVGVAGTAIAIAVLHARPELVDGPLGAARTVGQGHSAAVLLALTAAATGAAWAALSRPALLAARMPRGTARVPAAVALVAVVAAGALSHPAARLREFKTAPTTAATESIRAHLLSGSGSGRWQFWGTALDEFASRPVAGHGAGSFEALWARDAPIAYYVRNAHSLYLETLAELGLLGFVALVAAFGTGVAAAVVRARGAAGGERTAVAALGATLLAFLAGSALDWIWQLAAVGAVGVACLGLLTGRATAGATTGPRHEGGRRPLRAAGIVAVLAAGWVLIAAQAVPWLSDRQVRASRAAVVAGDLGAAARHAADAQALWPWASTPRLQVALVAETRGNLPAARRAIGEAIDRDGSDWRLWLVATRVATKAGHIRAARHDLARARALNPRSPLLARSP